MNLQINNADEISLRALGFHLTIRIYEPFVSANLLDISVHKLCQNVCGNTQTSGKESVILQDSNIPIYAAVLCTFHCFYTSVFY